MVDAKLVNVKPYAALPAQNIARRSALHTPTLQFLAVALGAAASIVIGTYAAHRHALGAAAPVATHVAASSEQSTPLSPPTPSDSPTGSNVSVTVQGRPVPIPPGKSRQVIHDGNTTTIIDTQQSHTGENSTTHSSVSVTVDQTTQEGGEAAE